MKNRRAVNFLVAFIGIPGHPSRAPPRSGRDEYYFSPKKDQNFPDARNRVPTDCGFAEVL